MEGNALDDLVAVADATSGYHEQGAEGLLGEVPVLASAPTPDIARTEQALGDDPRILNPLAGQAGVERNGHVQPAPDPRQPSAPGEVTEELASLLLRDAEDPGGFGYVKGAVSAPVQLLQVGAVPLADPSAGVQVRSNLHSVKCTTLKIYR
jgi:hypothetical protein